MSAFPVKLQAVLAADAAWRANDRLAHPRREKNLHNAYRAARAALKQDYPQLEEWLFGYPYRFQAERLLELSRLITGGTP